jgi:hypothetical protein
MHVGRQRHDLQWDAECVRHVRREPAMRSRRLRVGRLRRHRDRVLDVGRPELRDAARLHGQLVEFVFPAARKSELRAAGLFL